MAARGRVGWRWAAVVAVGAAALATAGLGLVGRPGPAQAQEAPAPVAFARSELTVPDGGAASLTLFNNTTAELLLTARVSPADEFAVAAAARTVAPGAAVTLRVSHVGRSAEAVGRVTAVAVAPGGNPLVAAEGGVARAEVRAAPAAGAAEPLVEEWSVTSYRFVPWGDATENAVLPLRDAESCDDVAVPEGTLGGVAAAPGSARVVASCREGGAPGADVGAALAFPGLGHHTGEYEGTIDLTPGAEGGRVRLVVRRTDHVLLPAAVAVLGVAAAVAVARVRRRLGDRSAGDRQAWRLLADVDAAHRAFTDRARDTGWAGYSFKADADARLRAIVDGRPEPGGPADGAADRGADGPDARRRLEPVGRAAAAWPALADRLAELDVAAAEVELKAAAYRPPGATGGEPACLPVARRLLAAPARPLTVREALAVAAEVDAAATMTERWLDWAAAVAQLEARADLAALAVDELPADHEDQRRLEAVRADLTAARTELWEAAGLTALDVSGALAAVERARSGLDALDHHVSGDDAGDRVGDGDPAAHPPALRATPDEPSPLAAALAGPATTAGHRSRGGRSGAAGDRRDRRRAAVALAGTGLVAAWSGLAVLYAGEAFGTPRDYAGLFVWAFAAQALLGALVAAADRVTAARPAPA